MYGVLSLFADVVFSLRAMQLEQPNGPNITEEINAGSDAIGCPGPKVFSISVQCRVLTRSQHRDSLQVVIRAHLCSDRVGILDRAVFELYPSAAAPATGPPPGPVSVAQQLHASNRNPFAKAKIGKPKQVLPPLPSSSHVGPNSGLQPAPALAAAPLLQTNGATALTTAKPAFKSLATATAPLPASATDDDRSIATDVQAANAAIAAGKFGQAAECFTAAIRRMRSAANPDMEVCTASVVFIFFT
jgi:hypothetical protein